MMNPDETVLVIAFALCAFVALAGALGMTTTMSMFRSGIFLMASFMGVGGLFILLAADLMGLLQIMMYIGGMLVMILFMVLFMHDPGGAAMAAMPEMMTPMEKFFSAGLQQERHEGEPHDHMDMGGMDMSMVTPVRGLAACAAAAIGIGLALLLLLRPAWPVVLLHPDPQSARAVGMMLMQKYMIAFEGAGFLILLGIFGAVFLARVDKHPDSGSRDTPVARTGELSSVEAEALPGAGLDGAQG